MGILCEAIIAPGSRRMADGSERLVLDLQELDRDQWGQLYDLNQKKLVKVYLSAENIKEDAMEIVDELEIEDGQKKSQAQRLRGVLYRLWEQGDRKLSAALHYHDLMDKIIEYYKEKLEPQV